MPDSIKIGEKLSLSQSSVEKLKEYFNDNPNFDIFLHACLTAADSEKPYSIAEKFAEIIGYLNYTKAFTVSGIAESAVESIREFSYLGTRKTIKKFDETDYSVAFRTGGSLDPQQRMERYIFKQSQSSSNNIEYDFFLNTKLYISTTDPYEKNGTIFLRKKLPGLEDLTDEERKRKLKQFWTRTYFDQDIESICLFRR